MSARVALVTGAHGFIGSHVVERLLAGGWQVRGLVSPWGRLDNLQGIPPGSPFEPVRANIADPAAVAGLLSGVTAVVHAAARVGDWGAPGDYQVVNVGGTRNLLNEAESAGVKRFVLVSTVAVHRYSGFREAHAEELPRDNDSLPYALSKRQAEDLVLAWPGEGVVVRPGLWPFGPRDPQLQRVIAALRSGRLPLVAGGRHVLNTAYVGNLAQGLELTLTAPEAPGRALVIADAGMPSWREVFGELARLLGVREPRLDLPAPLALTAGTAVERAWGALLPGREPPLTRYRATLMAADVHFSLEPARKTLGFEPAVSWQEGLRRSVEAGSGVKMGPA